jgi:hypothetical protein
MELENKQVTIWKIKRFPQQNLPFYRGFLHEVNEKGVLIEHKGNKGIEWRFVPWANIDDIEVK